jgi:hypothetical protein
LKRKVWYAIVLVAPSQWGHPRDRYWLRDSRVFGSRSKGGQSSRCLQVESACSMPLPAEHHGDGRMARATETEEIFQRLVAEVRIGCMMHLGCHLKLRAMIQELLRESDRTEIQLAYKLLKALLR